MKMKEDLLVNKDSDKGVQSSNKTISKIILRNVKAVKKLAKKEGISTQQLITYLKNE